MLEDTQRLMGTVEGVLRAARVTQKNAVLSRAEVAVAPLVQECDRVGALAPSSFVRGRWTGRRMASPATNSA